LHFELFFVLSDLCFEWLAVWRDFTSEWVLSMVSGIVYSLTLRGVADVIIYRTPLARSLMEGQTDLEQYVACSSFAPNNATNTCLHMLIFNLKANWRSITAERPNMPTSRTKQT
jgi:hypothetical protein